jgi:hypothetical protein
MGSPPAAAASGTVFPVRIAADQRLRHVSTRPHSVSQPDPSIFVETHERMDHPRVSGRATRCLSPGSGLAFARRAGRATLPPRRAPRRRVVEGVLQQVQHASRRVAVDRHARRVSTMDAHARLSPRRCSSLGDPSTSARSCWHPLAPSTGSSVRTLIARQHSAAPVNDSPLPRRPARRVAASSGIADRGGGYKVRIYDQTGGHMMWR